MRTRSIVLGIGLLIASLAPRLALADVNGVYQVTVIQSSATDPPDNCKYTGVATLNQNGTTLTGMANLTLVSGVCAPATLAGAVTGTVIGNAITLGIFGGFDFIGTVSNNGAVLSGTWDTGDPDAVGTWLATLGAPAPTLSFWGLAGLAILLGSAGLRRLRSV